VHRVLALPHYGRRYKQRNIVTNDVTTSNFEKNNWIRTVNGVRVANRKPLDVEGEKPYFLTVFLGISYWIPNEARQVAA